MEQGKSDIELTDDFYVYEQGDAEIRVRGRFRLCSNFLEEIGSTDFVLDTVKHGYKIPFYSTLLSMKLKNNKSVLNHLKFVYQAI